MTPQELKNSILQLAIQGKLVEQRPEEGTAEELYQQIQTEKQRLIKVGTIKKEKPLPEITEDEKPFDIPENWKWVRFCDVIDVRDGTHDTPKYVPVGIPLVTSKNLVRGIIEFETTKLISFEDAETINTRSAVDDGDILFAMIGTIGNPVLVKKDREFCIKNMALFKAINQNMINMEYFLMFLQNEQYVMKKKASGGVQVFVSLKFLRSYLFPIPPLAEQKRIVAKIEEMLPYIDRYEQAWSKLEDFNKRFPGDMQKSILQMAIQGKLVEQRPEEGTGEELYQQIQVEKQKLIKAGTIKKEKSLPEITEDEKPFDIPESWKWVRIGQIFSLQAGKNITASDIYEKPSPKHSFLCYGGNGIRGYVSSNNRSGHYALIGRQGALCGNINFANGDFYATEHAVVVDHFQMCDVLWNGYFLRALNLNQYATATAQPGLAVNNIVKVLIPLPPLAEQKRIVTKLEEILPLCEKLK